jgi:anthraniloyl-CoA monooxygenase
MPDAIASYRLSEPAILKMLKSAVEKAREIATPMGIGIVDAGGILRAWVLMDGATPLAFDAVLKKARTAAFTGRPSGGVPAEIAANLALAMTDFANLGGGFPILKDGHVLGAIAAGGGTSHEVDAKVANAGLAVLDFVDR